MNKLKICKTCKQKLPRVPPPIVGDTPNIRKIIKIMKLNNLNQSSLARLLGISQSTVAGWFSGATNIHGTIKPIYFDLLKLKKVRMK